MQQYVERMIREKEDLDGKIKRAERAVTDKPFNLTKEEEEMLRKQIEYMKGYAGVLDDRIGYAKNKED